MTRQIINVGTADKGNGDPIRVAFSKANANFAELYNILSNNTGGSIITTDVIGSVFADDSTLLVDGINGSIPYSVLSGTPTIPAAQVQSNWTAASGMGVILNKPTLFSGSYTDLTSKPTIPTLVSQLANDSGFLTSVSNISNIRSEGNINIDINLSDSTLRRWRFGEDGDLTFPDASVQTTAYVAAVWPVTNTTGTSGPTKIAIGNSAGNISQGLYAVAIGPSAGYVNQGYSAVAIGRFAGYGNQGDNAVAIGNGAGLTLQAANTIILNATGSEVNGVSAQTNSFYVTPIRTDATSGNVLYYNTTTKEVTYGTPIVPNGTKASNDTGTAGQTSFDSNYFYVCIATNTWRRVALGSSY